MGLLRARLRLYSFFWLRPQLSVAECSKEPIGDGKHDVVVDVGSVVVTPVVFGQEDEPGSCPEGKFIGAVDAPMKDFVGEDIAGNRGCDTTAGPGTEEVIDPPIKGNERQPEHRHKRCLKDVVLHQFVFFGKEFSGRSTLSMMGDGMSLVRRSHKPSAMHEMLVDEPLQDAAQGDRQNKEDTEDQSAHFVTSYLLSGDRYLRAHSVCLISTSAYQF